MFEKIKKSAHLKTAIIVLVCGGILLAFNNWLKNTKFSVGAATISDTLAPIFVGVICAFLVCPLFNRFVKFFYSRFTKSGIRDLKDSRKKLSASKAISTALCLLIIIGFISLLAYFILPQVITGCINLIETFPNRVASTSSWLAKTFPRIPQLADWLKDLSNMDTGKMVAWIQENVIGENTASIATKVSSGILLAANYVIDTVVGVLIMIYLLNYKETLFAIFKKMIAATCSEKRQKSLHEFSEIFNETFVHFITGQIIDSAILGCEVYIVLTIFKIPFAPLVSLLVGATNVIPFFGPFIGAIPSFLIIMLESPFSAFEFVIIILILQQIDGNIVCPKIVGTAIGISSFWVLIAVLIGGGLFGFMGMVFGVPTFAVIYQYVNKITTRKLEKKGVALETDDYYSLDKYGIDAKSMQVKVEKKETKKKSKKKNVK